MVTAGLSLAFSDGPGSLPVIFLTLAMLVVEYGAVAGLVASTVIVAMLATTMALWYQQPWQSLLIQTVAAALLLGIGLLVGQLLREVDRARRENVRLLEELRASLETEKDLVLAEERARAARDLHDGLGHQLTAIRMGLDYAERMHGRDDAAAREEVARCRDLSVVALDRMRVWVRALDPIAVHALTDSAAFEAVADAFRGTGLDVRVQTSGTDRPLDRATSLFALRVAQEGLTNALRHAGARHVDLVVSHGDSLTMTLTDDGVRSDEDDRFTPGYGLRALAQRASALGGTVTAGWCAEGFRLRAELPHPSSRVTP